jgi:hypothetical protein
MNGKLSIDFNGSSVPSFVKLRMGSEALEG